jgi:D-alanyl-D-alanine carboxypeptidase
VWYEGADGIKTGYIGASGFNLAASAVRNGHRLVGVVMGGASAGRRDREMAALLDRGFEDLGVTMVAHREAPVPPPDVVADAEPPAREKPGLLTKAAARLAGHLSPVGRAEAATLPRELHGARSTDRWSIQLGAFSAESTAEKAARTAASVPAARGKPVQIIQSSKAGKDRLYRARLLNFTPQEAWSACIELHKKKIECSVVPAGAVKVAQR